MCPNGTLISNDQLPNLKHCFQTLANSMGKRKSNAKVVLDDKSEEEPSIAGSAPGKNPVKQEAGSKGVEIIVKINI